MEVQLAGMVAHVAVSVAVECEATAKAHVAGKQADSELELLSAAG